MALVRLRTLSEAECYARCYGAVRRGEAAGVVRILPPEERDSLRASGRTHALAELALRTAERLEAA